jgi:hypothetical protein
MPVQTSPLGAELLLVVGALKTDKSLSTFLLPHWGQPTFSLDDETISSK